MESRIPRWLVYQRICFHSFGHTLHWSFGIFAPPFAPKFYKLPNFALLVWSHTWLSRPRGWNLPKPSYALLLCWALWPAQSGMPCTQQHYLNKKTQAWRIMAWYPHLRNLAQFLGHLKLWWLTHRTSLSTSFLGVLLLPPLRGSPRLVNTFLPVGTKLADLLWLDFWQPWGSWGRCHIERVRPATVQFFPLREADEEVLLWGVTWSPRGSGGLRSIILAFGMRK